jgi:hypothetical protein
MLSLTVLTSVKFVSVCDDINTGTDCSNVSSLILLMLSVIRGAVHGFRNFLVSICMMHFQ